MGLPKFSEGVHQSHTVVTNLWSRGSITRGSVFAVDANTKAGRYSDQSLLEHDASET